MEKIIFFGNGLLAECAAAVLSQRAEIIFWARTREDLEEAVKFKEAIPEAHAVLASFGVLIPERVLEVFEPEGILNIHPSLLPLYRGASPIESAIINGDTEFGVSVMKLAKAMDAGPIYFQDSYSTIDMMAYGDGVRLAPNGEAANKEPVYGFLASMGASWILQNLGDLPKPQPQDDSKATFCGKFTKKDGVLDPASETAEEMFRKIVAFSGFPKAKFTFYGVSCIVLEAHILKRGRTAVLTLEGADGQNLAVDRLQPEGRKAMDAKSFLNGYKK